MQIKMIMNLSTAGDHTGAVGESRRPGHVPDPVGVTLQYLLTDPVTLCCASVKQNITSST